MNSSQIFKRILPVLIVILIVIGAAVLISALNKDKLVPKISEEDGIYLTVKDVGRTYHIKNSFIYNELKSNIGLEMLLQEVDKSLLKKQIKGDSNYFDSVTEEEIDKSIEDEVFPDGNEDLTEEEIEKELKDYYRSLYLGSGLRTEAQVRENHRLNLAKKAYASDVLVEIIKTADEAADEDEDLEPYFTAKQFETKYTENFLDGYWALVIPFLSKVEADNALTQLGLKVDDNSNLVKIVEENNEEPEEEDEEAEEEDNKPSSKEIAEAFIEMYNTFYSRFLSDYPTNTLTLKEDIHYWYDEEGNLVFNSEVNEENEEMNKLLLDSEQLAAINKSIENALKGMKSYTESPTSTTWYTAKPRVYDSKVYVYMLKIKVNSKPSEDSVRSEIEKILFDEELTTSFINKKMAELRQENKLEVLDESLEGNYESLLQSYELTFKKTKEESESIVAKWEGGQLTANQLFAVMDEKYGLSIAISEVNYLRFLNSPTLNDIYDYYSLDANTRDRILDKDKWEEVRTSTVNEKNIFISGGYSSYPPSYGWKNFLRDAHGVSDTEELMYTLLYRKLRTQHATTVLDVEELTEDSPKWIEIVELMEKIKEDYFHVNGRQVLIAVKDIEDNYVPREEWTDLQVELAENLYKDIWAYLDGNPGDYNTNLNKLVQLFGDAPRYVASLPQDLAAQPELVDNPYVIKEDGVYNIEVSKYKTAGLSIQNLSVTDVTNSTTATDSMPEEFLEVLKEIFDLYDESTDIEYRYGYSDNYENIEYLKTKTGYHLYINQSITAAATWSYADDEEKHVLPTLQMIKTYHDDNAASKLIDEAGDVTDIEFTKAMKDSITKYFTPIQTEKVGSTNIQIILYKEMQEMDIEFVLEHYSYDVFVSFLNKMIEMYEESLTYINVEE